MISKIAQRVASRWVLAGDGDQIAHWLKIVRQMTEMSESDHEIQKFVKAKQELQKDEFMQGMAQQVEKLLKAVDQKLKSIGDKPDALANAKSDISSMGKHVEKTFDDMDGKFVKEKGEEAHRTSAYRIFLPLSSLAGHLNQLAIAINVWKNDQNKA